MSSLDGRHLANLQALTLSVKESRLSPRSKPRLPLLCANMFLMPNASPRCGGQRLSLQRASANCGDAS
jgi:hypothetical protein